MSYCSRREQNQVGRFDYLSWRSIVRGRAKSKRITNEIEQLRRSDDQLGERNQHNGSLWNRRKRGLNTGCLSRWYLSNVHRPSQRRTDSVCPFPNVHGVSDQAKRPQQSGLAAKAHGSALRLVRTGHCNLPEGRQTLEYDRDRIVPDSQTHTNCPGWQPARSIQHSKSPNRFQNCYRRLSPRRFRHVSFHFVRENVQSVLRGEPRALAKIKRIVHLYSRVMPR